jgi:hypothetical protein
MKYIALTILLLTFTACSKKLHTSSRVKDSTHIELKPRIVMKDIPGATISTTTIIECDSVTHKPKPAKVKAKSKGNRANVEAEVKPDGTLEIKGGCDSLQVAVEVLDKEITRLREEKSTEVRIEYKTRKIDIFCRWCSGAAIVSFIGVGILRLKGIL